MSRAESGRGIVRKTSSSPGDSCTGATSVATSRTGVPSLVANSRRPRLAGGSCDSRCAAAISNIAAAKRPTWPSGPRPRPSSHAPRHPPAAARLSAIGIARSRSRITPTVAARATGTIGSDQNAGRRRTNSLTDVPHADLGVAELAGRVPCFPKSELWRVPLHHHGSFAPIADCSTARMPAAS